MRWNSGGWGDKEGLSLWEWLGIWEEAGRLILASLLLDSRELKLPEWFFLKQCISMMLLHSLGTRNGVLCRGSSPFLLCITGEGCIQCPTAGIPVLPSSNTGGPSQVKLQPGSSLSSLERGSCPTVRFWRLSWPSQPQSLSLSPPPVSTPHQLMLMSVHHLPVESLNHVLR